MAAERTFLADLRMGLRPRFLLSILGVVLCFWFDNMEGLRHGIRNHMIDVENSVNCVMYYFFNSYSFGGVFSQYIAPMLAVIPLACSYCTEKQGRMALYKITRCGKKAYVRSKFLGASLLGGTTLLAGGTLFVLALRSFLPIVTPQKILESDWIPYYRALITGDGSAYLVIVLYLSFLSGSLWSSVGLCVSAFFPSTYAAICAPFVLGFFLCQGGRLLHLPAYLRLDMLLSARGTLYSDSVTLLITTAAVFGIICLMQRIFRIRIERGMQDAS